MEDRLRNLTGERYGKWTVAGYAERRGKFDYWMCRCDCGASRPVKQYNLLSGFTKSCGCIATARIAEIGRTANRKHGHSKSSRGRSRTYVSWEGMLQRARCPDDGTKLAYSYAHVTVCDRWLDFGNFLADMGERPAGKTLDRIDNMKGYEPGNCRWITQREQIHNTRPRRNRWSSRSNKAHRIGDYPWIA